MATSVGYESRQTVLPANTTFKLREIGSPNNPIKFIQDLAGELWVTRVGRLTGAEPNPIGVIVIYGDGNLEIEKDPGILDLDPQTLILIGARLAHKLDTDSLDAKMFKAGWYSHSDGVRPANPDALAITVLKVNSVKEALDAPALVNPQTNVPYRMIYEVKV
jgi:hypothetical protein